MTLFDEIDACTTIEEANELGSRFSAMRLKKMFWQCRLQVLNGETPLEREKALSKCRYINQLFAASVPVREYVQPFVAPHGFHGISISTQARLGKNCVIFPNVTIGSNTLPDSKNAGAPTIGDNVYIGAGATVIGNVKIGNNVRIGAGCSITIDIPDNATVVPGKPVILTRDAAPDNTWYSIGDFMKIHELSTQGGERKLANSTMRFGFCFAATSFCSKIKSKMLTPVPATISRRCSSTRSDTFRRRILQSECSRDRSAVPSGIFRKAITTTAFIAA